jgi:hypothetical protein
MRAVHVERTFDGTVSDAERCWYDTARWPHWVEGVERVVDVGDGWPGVGASVIWESGPAGRGRVTERVIAHEPLGGQAVEVRDGSIRGRQTVTFSAVGSAVRVALGLEYELLNRWLLVVDLLFIRRAMAESLDATLSRFGLELRGSVSGDPTGEPH